MSRAARRTCPSCSCPSRAKGVHAGRRQLFVRFAGCPLRCRWCDTPDSLVPVSECRILGADGARLRPNPLARRRARCRGARAARRLAAAARHRRHRRRAAVAGGLPRQRGCDGQSRSSCRCCSRPPASCPARLERVLPYVAIVSLDFKCPSNTGERARWDEHEACLATRRRGGPRRLREDAGRRHDRARGGRARRAPRGQRRSRCPAVPHAR